MYWLREYGGIYCQMKVLITLQVKWIYNLSFRGKSTIIIRNKGYLPHLTQTFQLSLIYPNLFNSPHLAQPSFSVLDLPPAADVDVNKFQLAPASCPRQPPKLGVSSWQPRLRGERESEREKSRERARERENLYPSLPLSRARADGRKFLPSRRRASLFFATVSFFGFFFLLLSTAVFLSIPFPHLLPPPLPPSLLSSSPSLFSPSPSAYIFRLSLNLPPNLLLSISRARKKFFRDCLPLFFYPSLSRSLVRERTEEISSIAPLLASLSLSLFFSLFLTISRKISLPPPRSLFVAFFLRRQHCHLSPSLFLLVPFFLLFPRRTSFPHSSLSRFSLSFWIAVLSRSLARERTEDRVSRLPLSLSLSRSLATSARVDGRERVSLLPSSFYLTRASGWKRVSLLSLSCTRASPPLSRAEFLPLSCHIFIFLFYLSRALSSSRACCSHSSSSHTLSLSRAWELLPPLFSFSPLFQSLHIFSLTGTLSLALSLPADVTATRIRPISAADVETTRAPTGIYSHPRQQLRVDRGQRKKVWLDGAN